MSPRNPRTSDVEPPAGPAAPGAPSDARPVDAGPFAPQLEGAPPAGDLAGLAAPASDTGERPRRRHRRTRPQLEQGPPPMSPDELAQFKQSVGATFGAAGWVLGRILGPHWQLSDDEAAKLGDAWGAALAPWVPGWLQKMSPILAALTVTAGIVFPRIQEDEERRQRAPGDAEILSVDRGAV